MGATVAVGALAGAGVAKDIATGAWLAGSTLAIGVELHAAKKR